MPPIKAIGTIFKFSSLKNKFPSNLENKAELELISSTIDFTLFENDLNGKVEIEFNHEPFEDEVYCVFW